MPDRDYRHRTLLDKLGVKRTHRTATIGVSNAELLALLAEALAEAPQRALRGFYDQIYLQIDTAADLRRIAPAAKHLKPDGALWILHPKGRSAAVKDAQVRGVYLACGLVDNKISAYTDSHTATRCVIPLNRRGGSPA